MANILRRGDEYDIFDDEGNRGTTDPINTVPTPQPVGTTPYIGPGFTPWVDRWDDPTKNVSQTTPTQVQPNSRPLYTPQEWANLTSAQRSAYAQQWGDPANTSWGYNGSGGGGGGGGGGDYSGGGGVSWPFGSDGFLFDDPGTALYESLIKKRISALNGPPRIQGLEEFTNALRSRMTDLQNPLAELPEVTQLKGALSTLAGQNFTPNAELETALRAIATRIDELNAPPFTALEEKGQMVKATDALEQQKQAARQQVLERMAARGIGAGSGVIEAALQASDRTFDALKAGNVNDLLMYRTDVGREQKNQAIGLGTTAAGLRGSELTRKDTFDTRKTGVLGQLAQVAQSQQAVNEGRKDQVVNLGATLADLGFNLENLTNARGTQQLQTAALLPDLIERRLQLALGTLNGGQVNLAPIGSQIGGYLQQSGYNRVNAPTTDWTSLFGQLGSIFGSLGANAFGGSAAGG